MGKLQYPKNIALIIENTEREMQILKTRILSKNSRKEITLATLTDEEKEALTK